MGNGTAVLFKTEVTKRFTKGMAGEYKGSQKN